MKENILVNLPNGFFETPQLSSAFERLDTLGNIRETSSNTPDEIKDDLAWADAVIMWSWPGLTDALLDQAPNLKYRGHIDIAQNDAKTAVKRDVPVSLSRHAWSPAVAEMGLTLILSTLRKTSDFHAEMWLGTEAWLKNIPADIDPDERQLEGQSVGIIGFGGIGQRINELLGPFHCNVKAYDPFLPKAIAEEKGVELCELNTLMSESTIIVVCAANNPGTQHLLGKEQIDLMQQNAILVNIARAALVDTDAMIARLEKDEIYAALDVFDKEPLAEDHKLRTLKNAYLTPHKAGGIMSSVLRSINWLIDDYEAVRNGDEQKYPLLERMIPGLDG